MALSIEREQLLAECEALVLKSQTMYPIIRKALFDGGKIFHLYSIINQDDCESTRVRCVEMIQSDKVKLDDTFNSEDTLVGTLLIEKALIV